MRRLCDVRTDGLDAFAEGLDRQFIRKFVELREQFRCKRSPMGEPLGAALRTLLAWQPDCVTGQRLSVAELADVAVDLSLELREWLKPTRVERNDKLAGVGDSVGLGIEVNTVAPEQRAVKRTGKEAECECKSRAFVAGHGQWERPTTLVRIDNSCAGLRIKHPVVPQRLILQAMILDGAVRNDRCRDVENARWLLHR